MKLWSSRLAVLAPAIFGLSGCTTDAYRGSIESALIAAKAVSTVTAEQVGKFRHEYRVSYLNQARAIDRPVKTLLQDFVCKPIAVAALPALSSDEVTRVFASADSVAGHEDSSYWALIVNLFRSYTVVRPRPIEDIAQNAAISDAGCKSDIVEYSTVDSVLTSVDVGAVPASPFEAFNQLIAVVGPPIAQALKQVDEQRRAAALREFFEDKKAVQAVRDHLGALTAFAKLMDKYARLRAMQKVATQVVALPPSWNALQLTSEASGPIVDAADAYDLTYQAQLSPAFECLAKSVDDLEAVATGADTGRSIQSSYEALAALVKAGIALERLANDDDAKNRWKALTKSLTQH